MLPVVDGGIAEEDKDHFDAGYDGLCDAFTPVDCCIDIVVNAHVVGRIEY